MTTPHCSDPAPILVAIDIAKQAHELLVELPDGRPRKRLRMANTRAEYEALAQWLHGFGRPVRIGFEPTGNYHRTLAHFLGQHGFDLALIPSLALARTRAESGQSWFSMEEFSPWARRRPPGTGGLP